VDQKLCTIDSVADYFSVSVSTVRNWLRQGKLPESTYIKIGQTYRFNLQRVAEAMFPSKAVTPELVPVEVEPTPVQMELDFTVPETAPVPETPVVLEPTPTTAPVTAVDEDI
jgi:excisionase family DNA binding protein